MAGLSNGAKLLYFEVKNTESTLLEPIDSLDIFLKKDSEFFEYAKRYQTEHAFSSLTRFYFSLNRMHHGWAEFHSSSSESFSKLAGSG